MSQPIRDSHRPASIDALGDLVAADMLVVNALILEKMQSPVALIPQLASHLIAAGGKRLRPMITIAAAQLSGYQGSDHAKLAACVEFIHTATLLHDDVVDESNLRRGLASANAVFGNKPSVLVGDFLFSRAFQLMVEPGSLEVLAILSGASAVIAEGEVLQLVTSNDLSTTEDKYLEVIGSKTAALFAAAAEVGGVIAGRPAEDCKALARFGQELGIAFQLIDDALDYAASQVTLGKTVGDDFREGKITLPIILAYAEGSEEERVFWRRTMEDLEQEDGDLAKAQKLLDAHNTIARTVESARKRGEIAKNALDRFPDSPLRRALCEAVDFAIERGY